MAARILDPPFFRPHVVRTSLVRDPQTSDDIAASESDTDSGLISPPRSNNRLKRGAIDLRMPRGRNRPSAVVTQRQVRLSRAKASFLAPPQVWDEQASLTIADNIGALLVSAQGTVALRKAADVVHRRTKRRAIRKLRARNAEGLPQKNPNGDTDTELDETDGDGGGFGMPNRRARERKAQNDVLAAAGASKPKRPVRRQPPQARNTTLDVAVLQPQPIRITYELPAPGDRDDVWFIDAFKQLYQEAENFVDTYFCMHDLKVGTFYEPWNINHTPEFLWWAEQIAEPDPATGWDSLLRDGRERKWLVMGIVMGVLRVKIFDEELFGCDEQEKEVMHDIEKTLFLSEGFHRTQLRAVATRTLIGNGAVAGNFYTSVAILTAQISLMLQPLTAYLYGMPVPCGTTLPSITDLYQSLHNLVSRAAQLSLTVSLSPTIFRFVDIQPGSAYEPDDVYSLELESYTVSKQRAVTPYETARAEWVAAHAAAKAAMEAVEATGPAARKAAEDRQKRIFMALWRGTAEGIASDIADATIAAAAQRAQRGVAANADTLATAARGNLYAAMNDRDPAITPEDKVKNVEELREKYETALDATAGRRNAAVVDAQNKFTALQAKVPTTTQIEIGEALALLTQLKAAVGTTQQQVTDAQMKFSAIDNNPPTPPGQKYRALTKIGVWPVITRYKAGGDHDDDSPCPDGSLRLSEKDGMRILQISKGAVVNYYGVDGIEKQRPVRLVKWVADKKKTLGRWGEVERANTLVTAAICVAGFVGLGWQLGWEQVSGNGLADVFQFVGSDVAGERI